MKVKPEKVYLYRTEINNAEVPAESYRELAYVALSRLDLALPETGTIVLKPYSPRELVTTSPHP